MKSAITFIILLAVASAQYTPDWRSCGTPSDPWIPTSVTLRQKPIRNAQTYMHACGDAQIDITVGQIFITAKLEGAAIYATTVPISPPVVVAAGSQYCLDFSVFIPIIAVGTFELDFELQDPTKVDLGCVAIILDV